MKKKHELLIHKKIDGLLSASEKKEFDELMAHSSEAVKYYNEIKKVDSLLASDARNPEAFDSTTSIMNTIRESDLQAAKTRIRIFTPQLLKYAAILVVGVLLGTVFSYTFFNTSEIDNDLLRGTIAEKNQKSLLFSDPQTSINVQTLNAGEIIIALLTIETDAPIECEIVSQNIETTTIVPLTNSSNLVKKPATSNSLTYTISGKATFQVMVDSENLSILKFTRGEKIIARKKLNKTSNFFRTNE